jgi:hypothetical protein
VQNDVVGVVGAAREWMTVEYVVCTYTRYIHKRGQHARGASRQLHQPKRPKETRHAVFMILGRANLTDCRLLFT